MLSNIKGRVVRIAVDDVNTDVIAPTEFRSNNDDPNLTSSRPHVMEAIRPGLDGYVRPGDVFVMGKNYGCGSHREAAVKIFKLWGVQAVIVESAGRIWFRNAIAAGLPVFQLENATQYFEECDHVDIDLKQWRIKNVTQRTEHAISPFPETVMRILEAGGMMTLLKQRVDARSAALGQ